MKNVVLQIRVTEAERDLFSHFASEESITLSAWARRELLASAEKNPRTGPQFAASDPPKATRQDIQQASIHLYDQDIHDVGNAGSWKAASLASIHLGGTVTHSAQCAHNRPAGECLQCEREARALPSRVR